jgi:hypothetical protein
MSGIAMKIKPHTAYLRISFKEIIQSMSSVIEILTAMLSAALVVADWLTTGRPATGGWGYHPGNPLHPQCRGCFQT